MDTEPYHADQYTMYQDPTGAWHVHNRFGCKGHSNHPIMALQIMQSLNWQVLAEYRWGESMVLPVGALEINSAAIEAALEQGKMAWLN